MIPQVKRLLKLNAVSATPSCSFLRCTTAFWVIRVEWLVY
jgi:hypothetical protein